MKDGEKKDFDDGKPDWKELMAMFEKMMARVVPFGGVQFVVTRDELKAHLLDRAKHYRAEAVMIADGSAGESFDQFVAKAFEMAKFGRRFPGLSPDTQERALLHDVAAKEAGFEEPLSEGVKSGLRAQYEEQKKERVEVARALGNRFAFMAAHLADVERFSLGIHDFETYEFVPLPRAMRGAA